VGGGKTSKRGGGGERSCCPLGGLRIFLRDVKTPVFTCSGRDLVGGGEADREGFEDFYLTVSRKRAKPELNLCLNKFLGNSPAVDNFKHF